MGCCCGAYSSAVLDEVKLLPLSGDMLYEAVQRNSPTAGWLGLEGIQGFAGDLV